MERTYKNPELTNKVHIIGQATIDGNIAIWKMAQACYDIVENKLWDKDFKNQNDFAKSIGKDTSTITCYKNAVAFIRIHPDMVERDDDNNIVGGITTNKADILSRVENYDGLVAYCIDKHSTEPYKLGDNALKKVISEFKKSLITDNTTDNTEDKKEDTPNVVVKNASEGKTSNVAFKDLDIGLKYEYAGVPLDIVQRVCELLKPYMVAQYNKEGEKIDG